jgi:hypothetical protein
MLSIWDLLVEQVFGGFWLSVVGLTFIFFIVLTIGTVSIFDILVFLLFFLLAMALGYGYAIVTIPIVILVVAWAIFQYMRFQERGGYG